MPVAYSESVLKLGDSGQFSIKLRADMDGLTNKCMHSSMKSVNLHYHCDILYTQPTHRLNQTGCYVRKRTSLVNKGQNMLHKLSFEANSMAISYLQVYE